MLFSTDMNALTRDKRRLRGKTNKVRYGVDCTIARFIGSVAKSNWYKARP